MRPARIAELLELFLSHTPSHCHSESGQRLGEACPERSRREPAVLSPAQLESISTYIDMLLRWNARINLTAVRDEEEIVTRHFGESLFAACHLFPKSYPVSPVPSVLKDFDVPNHQPRTTNPSIADLGSGAGFPGLPIKLWAPEISLTLIESNQKKANFLREVARALTLTDINIQNTRGEALPPNQAFDVVTLRAVEHFTTTLTVAADLVAPTGRLALLIGSSQLDQARSALPTFSWDHPLPIPMSETRILLVGTKEPKN